MNTQISEILGSRLSGLITSAFGDMEIAEEEIEAACKRASLIMRPLIFGSFLMLQPQMEMPPVLYRAHCRELLNRVADGEDINPPTSGEVATAFYQASLIAPLKGVGAAVYFTIVKEVDPAGFRKTGLEHTAPATYREDWPGQIEEERADATRMIAKRLTPRTPPRARIPGGERLERMARDGIMFPVEKAKMKTLYTLGYSGISGAELAEWAAQHGAMVIDSRLKPFSRKPDFTRKSLTTRLGERYQHVEALGNINYKNGGEIAIKNPADGYRHVLDLLGSQPVVLLCGCADVDTCHRKFIADELREMSQCDVVHLTPGDIKSMVQVAPVATPVQPVSDGSITQLGLFNSGDNYEVNPPVKQKRLF